jgi:iron(III) transport system permease protein
LKVEDVVREAAGRPGERLVFALLLLLLAAFILYPLARVLFVAFTGEAGPTLAHLGNFFRRPLFREALINSLLAAVAGVALASLVGVPLAVLAVRYVFPGLALIRTLAVLPLVVPPFVGAVAFQQVLGRSGMINLLLLPWLAEPIPFMEGLTGVVLVQALHYFPLIYLNTAASLANVDPALEEAARNLGAHGLGLFRRVTLPLAMPGFLAGALLVFIRIVDDLGTPLMLNYTKLLAPQAYLRITTVGLNDVDGYVICVVLVVISLAALAVARGYLGRTEYATGERGAGAGMGKPLADWRGWAALAASLILVGVSLIPHVGIILLSVAKVWSFSVLPSSYTLAHYDEILFRAPHFVLNTLKYALLASLADVVLGAAIAYLLVRGRIRGRSWLDAIATLPLAIPGVVLAVGYLRVFHGWDLPGLGAPLTASWLILVIAYTMRRLPYTVRACTAAMQQIPVTFEEAAMNLGAPPARAFRRITAPLMVGGLVAGGLIAFITSSVELASTILLVPRIELGPLAYGIYIYMQSALGRGPGAALGVVAILLVALGTALTNRIAGRGTGSSFRL